MNLLIGILVLAVVLVLALLVRAGYTAVTRDEKLRLPQMMQRRGAQLPLVMSDRDARDAGIAARRCAGCGSKALCDEWLQERAPKGGPSFCPNSGYINSLR